MKHFSEAICIREGIFNGVKFRVGDIYAVIGNNNASQLAYKDEIGETQIMMLFDYVDNTMHEWTVGDTNDDTKYPVFTRINL